MSIHPPLFEEFEHTTKEDWIKKVQKDLKGKVLEDLNWKPEEGIELAPYYHTSDLNQFAPSVQSKFPQNEWMIGEQWHQFSSLKETNKSILDALSNGVQAPLLNLNQPLSPNQFNELLKGINLNYIQLGFSFSENNANYLFNFNNWLLQTGQKGIDLNCSFSFSPFQAIIKAVKEIYPVLPKAKLIEIKAPTATLSTTEALGHLISEGAKWIQLAKEEGLSVEDAAKLVYFKVSIKESFFMEISKLRALKILWANVLKVYELDNSYCSIHAFVDQQQTKADDYTNMIRAAVQGLAGALGGVDCLFIPPYHLNLPSDKLPFGKRIARNVQHILKMEAFTDRVIDPAAGSYYVETLTQQLVKKSWAIFLEQLD